MYHKQNSAKVLRSYFSEGESKTYAKGECIVGPNVPATHMLYIASGAVRIYTNEHNTEFTHVIYGPGEIFPLFWLTHDRHQSSICEAVIPSELWCIPFDQLEADLANDNKLAVAMLRQTALQYRIYATRVANLEYKYASERVAYGLIFVANRFGIEHGAGATIPLPITHQLLATSLNLSRESVSREIEKLMQRGLMSYNTDRHIVLSDIPELAKQLRVPVNPGRAPEALKQL